VKASKRFFFEKKKQKTFVKLGHGRGNRHGWGPKVFCFFFSKKKRFSLKGCYSS
jgi:hypothetical protein